MFNLFDKLLFIFLIPTFLIPTYTNSLNYIVETKKNITHLNSIFNDKHLGYTYILNESNYINPNDIINYEEDSLISLESFQYTNNILWNLDLMDNKINGLYEYNYTGNNSIIYIIDSGINNNKEFLDSSGKSRILPGISLIDFSNNTSDCLNHGTRVSAIAAGNIYGVAKNAKIVPVKVFDCSSKTPISLILQGLDWIKRNKKNSKISIINMSIGSKFSSILNNAINSMSLNNFIIVVAAGNNGDNSCFFSPSSAEKAFTVGCITDSNTICSFSNQGPCVDIYAPGNNLLNGIKPFSRTAGTSFSSPHAAGVFAQILEKYPDISREDAIDYIYLFAANDTLKLFKVLNSKNLSLRSLYFGIKKNYNMYFICIRKYKSKYKYKYKNICKKWIK